VRSETVTAVLHAPADEVFDFLADVENLPEWATEFARRLVRDGDDYKVVNGLGEFFFDVRADASTGVIDMFAGPAKDAMALFPTRVVALPDGTSAFTFTMFQAPGMPDELFESQHASLQRELAGVERRFSG
jgi:polyketide cyclase/dehydrase/lipid transport protein